MAGGQASNDVIAPLPELPPDFAGTSAASDKNFKAEVSNKSGYLCHISLDAHFDVPPEILFTVFTNPDNAGVFRDIKGVGDRTVIEQRPGWQKVEVEQLGELRILWHKRQFSTHLTVEEDGTNPEHRTTSFELLKSDVLSKFSGRWDVYPVRDDKSGQVVGCRAVLTQDVLPKGVPTFLASLPLLGGMLRGVSLRAITRLIEDINYIIKKVKAGLPAVEAMQLIQKERGYKGTALTAAESQAPPAEQQHSHHHHHHHHHQPSPATAATPAAADGKQVHVGANGGTGHGAGLNSFAVNDVSDGERSP